MPANYVIVSSTPEETIPAFPWINIRPTTILTVYRDLSPLVFVLLLLLDWLMR